MIPFLDLNAQYRKIGPELEAAVLEVMRSGEYVLGSRVARFEQNFATYCGAREAVALNTGTSALHLALLALDIGKDDEVITTPMTFVATVSAIRYVGAKPVFVDIDPATGNIDPNRIGAAITPRTKAIIPVHLHGRLADMDKINAIAERHGIPIIEDACQAHGAEHGGKRAGTFGVIGCFSFYPGKNLGACGEGGAIVCDRADLAQKIRQMRDWGQTARYYHDLPGYNYRMEGIQGAVLDIKLRYLPEWTSRRQEIAKLYDAKLPANGVTLPKPAAGREHVYHVYAVRTGARERLQAHLKAAGIATNIHYPRPVHLQKIEADLGYVAGDFPEAEAFARETLSLPMYPEMTEANVLRVAEAIGEFACQKVPDTTAA